MVGGFLGAGKTTAMLRLAEHLTARGRRVGLITNDQSHGLVDTSIVAAKGYPVQEITGGCFCCRFNSLTDAADRLTRDARPGRVSRRARRQLHGPAGDGAVSVETPLRRRLSRRAAERARRSDARGAHSRARIRPQLLPQGSLRLREAARRGGHHRHQQERPPERRPARGARSAP